MNKSRRQQALEVRIAAAELAASRPHPRHIANGEEQMFRGPTHAPNYLMSYTKGLPHEKITGLIKNPDDFQKFVNAIDSGDPQDFRCTPLGPDGNVGEPSVGPTWKSTKAQNAQGAGKPAKVRAWESQGAGSTFDLEGPDAQAVTMPPAPALGSAELIAEIGEVYTQALLRDVRFTALSLGTTLDQDDEKRVDAAVKALNQLAWFQDDYVPANENEGARRRSNLTPQTAYRGITPGDTVGPYLSQFLLAGNTGINGNDNERRAAAGQISYGAVSVDQRVRFATPKHDYMVNFAEWFDVQNGADLRGLESYESRPQRRFITTPRDLATYVHYDALYEAYLNACLILLAQGVPFDPGIPFQRDDLLDHQQGFAHFGGPHILSLVTEVATRALKAVRFQKFNVHRRLRPEALAQRIACKTWYSEPALNDMAQALEKITDAVIQHNQGQPNGEAIALLPMAFCEGSPMHPSYGAGHATVAGACVTILKAFFDHERPLAVNGSASRGFVANADGSALEEVNVLDAQGNPAILTVEGELNKLASNISIGRDWAGVHYFTDYIESIRMGEQLAIGILEEQKLTYGENFSMTVPLFDGGSIRI